MQLLLYFIPLLLSFDFITTTGSKFANSKLSQKKSSSTSSSKRFTPAFLQSKLQKSSSISSNCQKLAKICKKNGVAKEQGSSIISKALKSFCDKEKKLFNQTEIDNSIEQVYNDNSISKNTQDSANNLINDSLDLTNDVESAINNQVSNAVNSSTNNVNNVVNNTPYNQVSNTVNNSTNNVDNVVDSSVNNQLPNVINNSNINSNNTVDSLTNNQSPNTVETSNPNSNNSIDNFINKQDIMKSQIPPSITKMSNLGNALPNIFGPALNSSILADLSQIVSKLPVLIDNLKGNNSTTNNNYTNVINNNNYFNQSNSSDCNDKNNVSLNKVDNYYNTTNSVDNSDKSNLTNVVNNYNNQANNVSINDSDSTANVNTTNNNVTDNTIFSSNITAPVTNVASLGYKDIPLNMSYDSPTNLSDYPNVTLPQKENMTMLNNSLNSVITNLSSPVTNLSSIGYKDIMQPNSSTIQPNYTFFNTSTNATVPLNSSNISQPLIPDNSSLVDLLNVTRLRQHLNESGCLCNLSSLLKGPHSRSKDFNSTRDAIRAMRNETSYDRNTKCLCKISVPSPFVNSTVSSNSTFNNTPIKYTDSLNQSMKYNNNSQYINDTQDNNHTLSINNTNNTQDTNTTLNNNTDIYKYLQDIPASCLCDSLKVAQISDSISNSSNTCKHAMDLALNNEISLMNRNSSIDNITKELNCSFCRSTIEEIVNAASQVHPLSAQNSTFTDSLMELMSTNSTADNNPAISDSTDKNNADSDLASVPSGSTSLLSSLSYSNYMMALPAAISAILLLSMN